MTLVPVFGFLLALTAGCQLQRETALEATSQAFIMSDAEQMDEFWGICQAVLRQNRFDLDRVNRRAGIITTFPVTSQQFFEFWRHDVDSGYDFAEASLHTVRRRAAVEMQSDDAEPLTVSVYVTVNVERLSAPERQFNNSAMALRYFGEEVPGVGGQKQLRRQDDYWIPLGRDPAMERYLLRKVIDHGVYVALAEPAAPPTDIDEPDVDQPTVDD